MAFFGTHLPEKAFSVCIKDGIFIDQTCGSGGFFYKGYNFVELYNPSADVLLFVRASNAEIYAMRLYQLYSRSSAKILAFAVKILTSKKLSEY